MSRCSVDNFTYTTGETYFFVSTLLKTELGHVLETGFNTPLLRDH